MRKVDIFGGWPFAGSPLPDIHFCRFQRHAQPLVGKTQLFIGLMTSQRHLNGGIHFFALKWLNQVAVRQRFGGLFYDRRVRVCGQKNDRYTELTINDFSGFCAQHLSFKVDIHQNEIRLFRRSTGNRFFPGDDGINHFVAEIHQCHFQIQCCDPLIFCDQNSYRRHYCFTPSANTTSKRLPFSRLSVRSASSCIARSGIN